MKDVIKFIEVNNTPKYAEGDIVGATLFDNYVVVQIEKVEVKKKNDYELQQYKDRIRPCCGRSEYPVNLNFIWYTTYIGRVKEEGIEHCGLAEINHRIKRIEERSEQAEKTLSDIREMV